MTKLYKPQLLRSVRGFLVICLCPLYRSACFPRAGLALPTRLCESAQHGNGILIIDTAIPVERCPQAVAFPPIRGYA